MEIQLKVVRTWLLFQYWSVHWKHAFIFHHQCHYKIYYWQHNLSSSLQQWFILVVCCPEKIIKKLPDFSLVKSKSFLCSCFAPGTGTWSTERKRGVGGVGGGGKHVCRWELVVPVNTWSQRGNEMISFTCKSCVTECTAFHPLHTRR